MRKVKMSQLLVISCYFMTILYININQQIIALMFFNFQEYIDCYEWLFPLPLINCLIKNSLSLSVQVDANLFENIKIISIIVPYHDYCDYFNLNLFVLFPNSNLIYNQYQIYLFRIQVFIINFTTLIFKITIMLIIININTAVSINQEATMEQMTYLLSLNLYFCHENLKFILSGNICIMTIIIISFSKRIFDQSLLMLAAIIE